MSLNDWNDGWIEGRKAGIEACIAAVDDYFDRGECSPAQLMDDLHALLSNDSVPDPASKEKP